MSDTPVAVEHIKLTITVGPNVDPTKFEEPIDQALDKITDICSREPTPLVSIELNVTTLKEEMNHDAFAQVFVKLHMLFDAIDDIPVIISSSLHFTRNHVIEVEPGPQKAVQQDAVFIWFLVCFFQMGKVPYLNLAITTNIEDQWIWESITSNLLKLCNQWRYFMESIKAFCIVLQFRDSQAVVNLHYDLRYWKRLFLTALGLLQKINRNLVLKYYIGLGIGEKLIVNKHGIERKKKIRGHRRR
ncbi:hypothetical protein CVT24_001234 [Panaeolus cyanescens]|uniref:Uncharacterized protein n=1 Tax=Panaeolus cyanescens TaxID=181874 RepID=A0A409YZ09_9AGAR|nr:hypothetical protein CVT24_001234 [Panaeolus cyanescens]